MPNLSEVQTLLIQNMNNVLSNEIIVINDKVNNPKPNGLFIRVGILNLKDKMLKAGKDFNNQTGITKRIFLNELIFDLNAYGIGAFNYLYELKKQFEKQSINDLFLLNKISIIDTGQPKKIPLIEGEQDKEKSNLELKLNFLDDIIDDIGYFNKVELKASFFGVTQLNTTFIIQAN